MENKYRIYGLILAIVIILISSFRNLSGEELFTFTILIILAVVLGLIGLLVRSEENGFRLLASALLIGATSMIYGFIHGIILVAWTAGG